MVEPTSRWFIESGLKGRDRSAIPLMSAPWMRSPVSDTDTASDDAPRHRSEVGSNLRLAFANLEDRDIPELARRLDASAITGE
jgi:hypothetical protein